MALNQFGQYVPGNEAPEIPASPGGGSGSPEGVVIGSPFDFYVDTDDDTLYSKETGIGTNTGWVSVGGGGGPGGSTPTGTGFRHVTSGVEDGATVGESGTGNVVRVTSATLVTPTLGAAAATSINKVAITAPAASATLTIANTKTLSVSNTLTLAGTDSAVLTFQGTDTYVGRATTDTLTNKTLTTPTIGSFANANHDHSNSANGGALSLNASSITAGTLAPARGGALVARVTLTDAATVATDASLGKIFEVTLGGNRTLGAPTNPPTSSTEQERTWEFIQDGTGTRTLALDTGTGGFLLGVDITGISLSTVAAKHDMMTAIYNPTLAKWIVVRFLRGYN